MNGMMWCFKTDKRRWKAMTPSVMKVLEDAFQKNNKATGVTQPSWQYTFDLSTMKQRNARSGFIRDIQRMARGANRSPTASALVPTNSLVPVSGKTAARWYFMHPSGHWKAVGQTSLISKVEAEFQKDNKAPAAKLKRSQCVYNFKNMERTVAGVSQKLLRLTSGKPPRPNALVASKNVPAPPTKLTSLLDQIRLGKQAVKEFERSLDLAGIDVAVYDEVIQVLQFNQQRRKLRFAKRIAAGAKKTAGNKKPTPKKGKKV